MGSLFFQIGLFVALVTSQVCLGVVSVSMDGQFRFVVHGQGEQLAERVGRLKGANSRAARLFDVKVEEVDGRAKLT